MGGVAKSVGSALGNIAATTVTGGMNKIAPHSLFGQAGNAISDATSNPLNYKKVLGDVGINMGGNNPSIPGNQGKVSPIQTLQMSGGAPLLASIAMGADPNQSIMSFFGASGDYNTWLQSLDSASQDAVKGLSSQLNQIATNTQSKTQVVQNLVKDFPDFMASAIPQYKGIADKATMDAAQQALNQTAAKYAAGGQLSSGAMAAAMARTGADTAYQNLQFGANLATRDWTQQFNQANALQNFQQKMLGQGATEGFNAVQNMLSINAGVGAQSQKLQYLQDQTNRDNSGALFGTLGKVGGGLVGGYFGGPAGAAAGSALGGAAGSYLGGQ